MDIEYFKNKVISSLVVDCGISTYKVNAFGAIVSHDITANFGKLNARSVAAEIAFTIKVRDYAVSVEQSLSRMRVYDIREKEIVLSCFSCGDTAEEAAAKIYKLRYPPKKH